MFKKIGNILLSLLFVASFVSVASAGSDGIMLAKASKSSRSKKASSSKSSPKTREANIVREAKYTKDRRDINFESENLYGQRKLPMSSIISQTKSDKDFDLIKIRDNWNPEMVQSTSALELGR